MLDMVINSFKLLIAGKLFRDPKQVLKQYLIAFALAIIALVIMIPLGVPTWLAVLLVSLAVGALQPWLFKDLKYN